MRQCLSKIVSPKVVAYSANFLVQSGLFAAYATWVDNKQKQQLPSPDCSSSKPD